MPSSKAWFGQMPSTTTTPRCSPSKARAWTTTLPRRLPSRTRSPSAMPSAASVGGMDQHGRPALAREPSRDVVEAGVEERARRRRHQAERVLGVAVVDHRDMIGKRRQRARARRRARPSRRGNGTACRHGRSRRGNARSRSRGAAIEPAPLRRIAPGSGSPLARSVCSMISDCGHVKAGMLGAEALGELADDVVVRARLGIGLAPPCAADLQKGVAAGGVDVVMLEEGRRRQHDVGHRARSRSGTARGRRRRDRRARKPSRTSSDSGATTIGLVFWIRSAVTGGPSPRSRLSPVRIGPMRDWSRMRVLRIDDVEPLDQASGPDVAACRGSNRARRRLRIARRRSPPAGRSTANSCAAPLRWREKP